ARPPCSAVTSAWWIASRSTPAPPARLHRRRARLGRLVNRCAVALAAAADVALHAHRVHRDDSVRQALRRLPLVNRLTAIPALGIHRSFPPSLISAEPGPKSHARKNAGLPTSRVGPARSTTVIVCVVRGGAREGF